MFEDCIRTDDPRLHQRWLAICHEQERQKKNWIDELRQKDVKAAHPDDGWVNHQEDCVVLSYPQFNDGLRVGDVMALGWPGSYRLVRITRREKSCLGLVYWFFVDVENGVDKVKTIE